MPGLNDTAAPSGGYDFDAFFGAIAGQESGGNYQAINASTGALGKYQVMPANVPYWSQKYLGVKWSAQQFLSDPTKQEQLARSVLNDYYQRFGARGAAAAWYSGNPANANNYGPQNGGPSIGSYVDSVMRRAAAGGMSSSAGREARTADYSENVTDNSVKDSTAPQNTTGQPAPGAGAASDAPGVGAAYSPGITSTASTTPGADSVSAPGQTATDAPSASTGTPSPVQAPDGGAHTAARDMAVAAAKKWVGTPYVWGGGGSIGPSRSAIAHGNYNDVGFDCSGIVQYALAQSGINAPRLSYDQLKLGARTDVKALQAGDLVGFGDGGHIALYLGNNQILEAPSTGSNVRVRSLGQGENAWGVSLADLYK